MADKTRLLVMMASCFPCDAEFKVDTTQGMQYIIEPLLQPSLSILLLSSLSYCWMVGWMDGSIDRWMDQGMDRWMDRRMDRSMDGSFDASID